MNSDPRPSTGGTTHSFDWALDERKWYGYTGILREQRVATDQGTVAGFPFARALGVDDFSGLTKRDNEMSPAADTWATIFSISSGEYVIGGTVFGAGMDQLRYPFDDGSDTTRTITWSLTFGDDGNDNLITVLPVFPAKNVKQVEVFNESGTNQIGATVVTA